MKLSRCYPGTAVKVSWIYLMSLQITGNIKILSVAFPLPFPKNSTMLQLVARLVYRLGPLLGDRNRINLNLAKHERQLPVPLYPNLGSDHTTPLPVPSPIAAPGTNLFTKTRLNQAVFLGRKLKTAAWRIYFIAPFRVHHTLEYEFSCADCNYSHREIYQSYSLVSDWFRDDS